MPARVMAYCDSNHDIRLKMYTGTPLTSVMTRFRTIPLDSGEKVSFYSIFQAQLHRKLLLNHLKLLCCCVELQDDMVWCIKQWKEICQCMEDLNLNSHMFPCPPESNLSAKITLGDVCDILVNERGHKLSYSLTQSNKKSLLELVIFERHLVRGILAIIIGHTSLLGGIHDNMHLLLQSKTSWEECSSAIGTEWVEVCCQLEGRVWQNGGQRLIAMLQILPQDKLTAVKEIFIALSGMFCHIISV